MKTTLTTLQIANRLLNDEYSDFSHAGAIALAEHLEEMEASTGEEMEFDAVAIRCEYSEYESLAAWAESHFGSLDAAQEAIPGDWEDMHGDLIRSYILSRGTLIEFDPRVIVSCF